VRELPALDRGRRHRTWSIVRRHAGAERVERAGERFAMTAGEQTRDLSYVLDPTRAADVLCWRASIPLPRGLDELNAH
jgi:nucleoside-diphosphate-sugar epimerase